MQPLPASYYGSLDKSNPVILAFEKDLKEFRSYVKRIRDSLSFDHCSYLKGSLKLFDIWKKYEPRLPSLYYEETLLDISDFLFENNFYRLALWQGYKLYLQRISPASLESIRDVKQFEQVFFPQGFHTAGAKLTLRALYGECVCVFHLERERCKQPDCIGMQKLLSILGFLRIIMQAILPHESLCWLLYNGSLYIYNICRFLMSVSHSAQAIEYLLWACVCLETSIPLLTPRFLPWRATLYCSVCECYYSGEAAVQAEVFARQALAKIDELGKLQKMTGLPSTPETNKAFKDATIKVAAMVFKRLVYESQRKPKGFFRLKQKGNLKDVQNPQSPWPRTTTERILMELFEGNAAQFLAVLEALWDSSRRPLQTGTLDDPDDQEVAIELMSAGISILSGIGGSPDRVRNDSLPLSLNALAPTCTLLEMAIAGENQISVDAAVKFVKLLFRYEQWDVFCSLSDNLVTVLSSLEGRLFRKAELELTLLEAMERVLSTQRVRQGTKDLTTDIQSDKDQPSGLISMTDELLNLVQTLHVCVCEAAQDIRPDEDLVLDIVLFLWAKYKLVFQRVQARPDPACYIGKMAFPDKWVQTLFLLCEVAYMCQLPEIDPVAVAEMTLRLTSVLEISADSLPLTIPAKDSNKDINLQTPSFEKLTATPSLNSHAEHLEVAWTVLEKGLECVSRSRTVSLSHDASAISDTVFLQKFSGESLRSSEHKQIKNGSSMRSLLIDMHMELLAFQHRIFFKLLDIYPDDENPEGKKKPLVQNAQRQFTTEYSERARAEGALQEKIKKNKISKVLFLAQKALFLYKKDATNKCTKKLLEEALTLLEKAGLEEKRMTISATSAEMGSGVEEGCRPPPPVLLSRSNRSLTFTPAPYMLEEQVCWYGIYGKEVERVNLKVRTRDCHLVGTGEMISSRGERLFHISGLKPNQKYVFAVAAYDAQGNLIGSRIGDTTRPVLASLPLPLLTTWGHLAQVAYQTRQYTLAKKTCSEIWSHFTLPSVTDSGVCEEPVDKKATERLAQTKLCPETLQLSSPVLQQLFLTSIFIQTNIHIQEGALYCDSLSDGSPLIWGQEARLAECEKMLVAIDLSLHLNDSNVALQAVVTCYGLLAPLVFYQIPSDPVIQVLLKCLKVLQKISAALKQKRPVATSESLYHMVACITQYVGKGLKDEFLASSVMEQGKQLLLEMNENLQPQDRVKKPQKKAEACSQEAEPSEELKALTCIALMQHEKLQTFKNRDDPAWNREANYFDCELSGEENPNILYKIIGSSSLRNDFQNVMKFKEMSCFMEFAALLLQKALQKDELELLIQWGQEIFNWLKSRDENLTLPKKPNRNLRNDQKKFTSSIIQYCIKINRAYKKKNVLKKSVSSSEDSEKEFKAVETLMKQLGLLRRHQQQRMMRQVLSDELPWRCLANLTLAQAHLGLLRRNFQLHPVAPAQHCYSKLSLHFFSLAHSGTLVKWSNISQHIKPPELSPLFLKPTIHKAKGISQGAANINGETSGESEVETDQEILTSDSDCSETTSRNRFKPLDTIYKASIYLRRAMVLAYRGSLWTSLQWVCENLWDQFNSIAFIIECNQSSETYSTLTLDQFYTVFTPLLALASDLLMDMIEKLQLWKVYYEEGEELEARPLNAGMLVDLKWMKNLVLHTLELLFYQAKWETLVHLALIYNFYTRERYTHIITPVLVYAQRRLLERISSFGGPLVPQPHFTYTESVTGEKVTCRNYAEKQLLLHSSVESWLDNSATKVSSEPLELEERKRAMCVVSVPLDINDTLHCFRESLSKRCHTVCSFQHSHTLLMLLLAEAQHSIEAPFCEESFHGEQARVEFKLAASMAPSISPPDLSNEDYNSMGSVYSSPLSPSHIQTVLSSYNSSIKYLQENNYNSLQVQALHDLGNLHFYNGNLKAAHSNWSKALDHALQTTNVLESWDGDSSSQPLRHAGIWGCLQGALLSAKIAQYILTSNISQRTNCCFLSAKLFKCLLKASMPHPDNDLEYSSYTLNTELIPGMNVFSEVDQTFAGSTVASLDFLCHWLYTSGHHLTALPLVVLYQYVASTVCRHPQLTAASRILKVKMLTELHLFAEAVKEIHNLCDGEEVPLPYSSYVKAEKVSKWKMFSNYKPLTDPCNLEVLEELVNKKITEDIMAFYSTKLTCRLHIARLQLILAMCRTMHDLPEPFTEDLEALMRSTSPCWRNSGTDEFSSSTSLINVEPKGLQLQSQKDALTPGQIKALLLKEIFEQLSSELFAFQHTHTDPEELELAVEIKLLLSSLTLQQGKAASSADQAASALRLLQDCPLLQNDSIKQLLLKHPSSVFKQSRIKTEQLGEPELDAGPQLGDVPAAVEALERMGRSLWLRCTLALVQSLTAHIPGTVIYPGVDSSVEADGLIRQGLADAEAWGDPDTQTMLLLQRVTLNTHCGRALEESTSMLQEVVSVLSGCSALSLHSGLLLAKATLLLGELRGSDGQSLYLLAQKLLQQQLKALGEGTVQKAGGESIPAWRNIYHPQLPLLSRTTMHLGQCLALQAVLSSKKDDEQHSNLWLLAQEELHNALIISRASATRDPQLEANILYLKGSVERVLMSLGTLRHQTMVKTFLESITRAHSHSHSLQLIHACYMELSLIYLQNMENSNNDLAVPPWRLKPNKCSDSTPVAQSDLLLFWVCLRAAGRTMEVLTNHARLCGITAETEDPLPLISLQALADFASNDLLIPCGGLEEPMLDQLSSAPDTESSPKVKRSSEITWVHLSRYYTHLLNLRHISTQPMAGQSVDEVISLAGDSNLTLRLNQLHTFFSDHLTIYKKMCVIPDPPSALILEPQTIQQSVSRLYPWAALNKHQLCIQWHRHILASSRLSDKMITLVFALNKDQMSNSKTNIQAAADIKAGHRLISLDSLKALHVQLISVCVEAEVDLRVPAFSSSSKNTSVRCLQKSEPDSRTPVKVSNSTLQQILLEKTSHICTEIRNLLKPDLKEIPITKVPFKPSVQILCDLERCFNPASGATLEDKALSDWLFSLLT